MNSKLRHLKNNFLAWAIKWASMDDIVEETPFDLPEVVNVLQAIGFQLREIDKLDVKDISLRNGEKGMKAVLTCIHSGQIFHLEKPTEDKSCKCIPISDDNARDGFWEVSAIKPSKNQSGTILETGSDLIPPLSKDMVHFISGIANQTFQIMMNEKQSGSLNNSFLSSPGKSLSKSFDFPALEITSPGSNPYKPIRYGSLDAIPSTYKASREITRQLSTARAEVVPESYQMESYSTKDNIQYDNEIQQLGELFPLIERAHCDLSKVIDVMKRCNLEDTSCIYNSTANETTESIPTITISESPSQNSGASGTIPKLVSRSKTGVLNASKASHYTPRASSSPGMIGVSSKLARPQAKSATKPENSKAKLQESIKNTKLTQNLKTKDTPTRSSKYAHIKSTIPKPAPAKKK